MTKAILSKIGESSHRLTATGSPYKIGREYYIDTLCECGGSKTLREYHFRKGNIKSCGCLRKETIIKFSTSHGMSDTPTHVTWKTLKQRCDNQKHPDYPNYGGRGITYDPRWESFESFYEDMGERPEGLTLDRKDNDGNYCKENCRWESRSVQTHNQRKIERLGHFPTTSEFIGVSYNETVNKWNCKISHNNKVVFTKQFSNEIAAARAYDEVSFRIYGDRPNEKILKRKENRI